MAGGKVHLMVVTMVEMWFGSLGAKMVVSTVAK